MLRKLHARNHLGKPKCFFLPFDASFTDDFAKSLKFHRIFTFRHFHPLITWADYLKKCCIMLHNFAKLCKI
jgi:hypothetical protein